MSILIESFEDHYYTHAISLKHMESALKRRVLGFLQVMEQDILTQMEGRGLQYQGPIAGVDREARLNAMLSQIRQTIDSNYSEIAKDSKEFLTDFVSMEAFDQVDLMNSSIRMPLFNVVLTQNAVQTLVDTSIIRGSMASGWWDRQKDNTQNRIITQIQLGFAEGEGIGEIRRRIIGKATGKWQQVMVNGQKRRIYERVGGIVDVSKREADALVRTAIQTLSGRVRDRIYEQNDDIVDQVESMATLDSRTTPLCASYDNLRWTQKSHSPVGHNKMYLPTPRHWNCRSTHIPVMVELERLEKQAREAGIEIPQSMRASMDGPQPAMRSMEDWLKTKPPEFQRQVIGGKKKTELFNEGKLSLRDLTDEQGKVRTLRELMQLVDAPSDGLPYAITRKPIRAEIYDSFRRNVLQEPGISLDDIRPRGGLPTPVITKPTVPETLPKSPTQLEREHIEKTKVSGYGTGFMAEGINKTELLKNDFQIVFKPRTGETGDLRVGVPGGTYYRREVAASIIDEELGLNLVPTTGIKQIEGNIGSAQRFVEGFDVVTANPSLKGTDLDWISKTDRQTLEGMNLFDYILFNMDRHNGNWMVKYKSRIIDNDTDLELTPAQTKKLLTQDQWNAQVREWNENNIDPIDRIFDRVKGYKGKTNFGGDYGEYLTDQNLRLDISDVEISLIDNGLSLPQFEVSMGNLVRNPEIKKIFQDQEISPFWMNKLENFLDREQQIRSRLDPLELDTDSLGQGKTLDLMFDRVRQLVQYKTHFDPLRPGEVKMGPGSYFERQRERDSVLRKMGAGRDLVGKPFTVTDRESGFSGFEPASYQPEQIPEIASAIKTKQEIGPKPKKRR